MPATIRTFIAIPIDYPRRLADILLRLKSMGRALRTDPDGQGHLTLAFLGDTPFTDTARVSRIISEHVSRHCKFQVRLQGLGVFPRPERPRMVWAGITPTAQICDVVRSLRDPLVGLGFPQETRKFVPHLTLARVRSQPPDELAVLLDEFATTDFGPLDVDRVIYYRSELKPAGPVYTTLSEHMLET
jgi:2'-5' RNA ligase